MINPANHSACSGCLLKLRQAGNCYGPSCLRHGSRRPHLVLHSHHHHGHPPNHNASHRCIVLCTQHSAPDSTLHKSVSIREHRDQPMAHLRQIRPLKQPTPQHRKQVLLTKRPTRYPDPPDHKCSDKKGAVSNHQDLFPKISISKDHAARRKVHHETSTQGDWWQRRNAPCSCRSSRKHGRFRRRL